MQRLLRVASDFGVRDAYAIPQLELVETILALQASAAPPPAPEPGPHDDHDLQRSAPPAPSSVTGSGGKQGGAPPPAPPQPPPPANQLECALCLEAMGPGTNKPMAAPKCGHVACEPCLHRVDSLAAAGQRRPRCSVCRTVFTRADIIRIYA
jgi:hypothetical protein